MSRELGKNDLPAAPINDRVLLLRDPVKEQTKSGLYIPGQAQMKPNTGKLVSAGLKALDRLHDHGIEIGDSVVWGQFAGVLYEWDHVVKPGTKRCQSHDWHRSPAPYEGAEAYNCADCGAERWNEPMILANVDDVQASVDLEQRKRSGEVSYKRGKTAEGQTQHFIDRKGN